MQTKHLAAWCDLEEAIEQLKKKQPNNYKALYKAELRRKEFLQKRIFELEYKYDRVKSLLKIAKQSCHIISTAIEEADTSVLLA